MIPLRDLLSVFKKRAELARFWSQREIQLFWPDLISLVLSKKISPDEAGAVFIKKNTLLAEIPSATLGQELSFRQAKILKLLKKRYPTSKINSIQIIVRKARL